MDAGSIAAMSPANGGTIGVSLLLSAAAGAATSLGGVVVVAARRPGRRLLAFSLGFACGVMIWISFAELLPEAVRRVGRSGADFAFLAGMLAMFLVDCLVPHHFADDRHDAGVMWLTPGRRPLFRTGVMAALGLGIHNFPEGMATFTATLADMELGVAVGVATALHNIPEGIAVAAPVYAATGSRGRAFVWALASGLAEPVGALLAAAVLAPILSPAVLGATLAAVGGLMVYVSLDELLPASLEHGDGHLPIIGVTGGMAAMALALNLL